MPWGGNPRSFCQNTQNLLRVTDLNGTALAWCDCPLPKHDPIWKYNTSKTLTAPKLGIDPYGFQKMLFWRDRTTGVCMPACGHGAALDWDAWNNRQQIKCTCPGGGSTFGDRSPYCSNYTEDTNFHVHKCHDRGQWVPEPSKGPKAGHCICVGLYRTEDACQTSSCEPEGHYSPLFGEAICNCTYPYRTDLDYSSKTFGSCISDCVHGTPNLQMRNCKCDTVAWAGRRCELSVCGRYGTPCPVIAAGKPRPASYPCCCSTPVVTGAPGQGVLGCRQSNCLNGGTLRESDFDPPMCVCPVYFAGAQCEVDRCGILGDGNVLTGWYSGDQLGGCECAPGYMKQGMAPALFCTRPRCGERGTVVQVPKSAKYPEGFFCRCDGPDTLEADGACAEGDCQHGYLIEGTNGTRAWCRCDLGWSGADCSVGKCPNERTQYEPLTGGCSCIYPFVNEATGCEQDLCGPGALIPRVRQTNQPFNPLSFDCNCDAFRGFVLNPSPLLQQTPQALMSMSAWILPNLMANANGPLYACVLPCVMNHTRLRTMETCECYPGFRGRLCEIVDAVCPLPPPPVAPAAPGVSYAILGGSLGGMGVLLIIAVVVTWALVRPASGSSTSTTGSLQTPAQAHERIALLSDYQRATALYPKDS